jgi:hypothetical protein
MKCEKNYKDRVFTSASPSSLLWLTFWFHRTRQFLDKLNEKYSRRLCRISTFSYSLSCEYLHSISKVLNFCYQYFIVFHVSIMTSKFVQFLQNYLHIFCTPIYKNIRIEVRSLFRYRMYKFMVGCRTDDENKPMWSVWLWCQRLSFQNQQIQSWFLCMLFPSHISDKGKTSGILGSQSSSEPMLQHRSSSAHNHSTTEGTTVPQPHPDLRDRLLQQYHRTQISGW